MREKNIIETFNQVEQRLIKIYKDGLVFNERKNLAIEYKITHLFPKWCSYSFSEKLDPYIIHDDHSFIFESSFSKQSKQIKYHFSPHSLYVCATLFDDNVLYNIGLFEDGIYHSVHCNSKNPGLNKLKPLLTDDLKKEIFFRFQDLKRIIGILPEYRLVSIFHSSNNIEEVLKI